MTLDPKLRRHLTTARREIKRAVERAAEAEETVGLREGHKVEALRQVREVRAEVDRLLERLDRP